MAHAKGVKVLLLIGGDFPGVENNGTLLTLIEKLAAFAAKHDYDGFDIDWEYPETTQDRDFLVELMAGLRETNSDYVLVHRRGTLGRIRLRSPSTETMDRLFQYHDVRLRWALDR